MSNQDYSRHMLNLSESVKSRPPAAYYSEISSHFDLMSSPPSLDSMQKALNFVHKRKKSDSISLKANQNPPNPKGPLLGNFFEEAKVAREISNKQSRSKSRPKFDEDPQNSQKTMQHVRTFNSLSTNKSPNEQAFSSQPSLFGKQASPSLFERDTKRIIKYLLPKTKPKKNVNSYSFQREINDGKPRKFFDNKKGARKNSPLNKTNESKQAGAQSNFIPNLPRDGLISQSFAVRGHPKNYSNSNSILNDNSRLQLMLHDDQSSSGFNFESPVASNRAIQESKFNDAKSRFSPNSRRTKEAEAKRETSASSSVGATKKQVRRRAVDEDGNEAEEGKKPEFEGALEILTKSSIEGSQSNTYAKAFTTLGSATMKSTSHTQPHDLKKNFSEYSKDEVEHHIISFPSPSSANPSLFTKELSLAEKISNPTKFVLMTGTQDQQGEMELPDDFETSRFNNNLLLTTDNNIQYSQSVQEILNSKNQANIYIEANTARVEKVSSKDLQAPLASNFEFETNIARGMNAINGMNDLITRPRNKTQSEQQITSPFTSLNSPNSYSVFEAQTKELDPYLFKRDPSKVLEITTEMGGGIRIKNNEILNQKKLICSPKVTKLERITEIRTDTSQTKTMRVSEKDRGSVSRTRSNTPSSTSRHNRSVHDSCKRGGDQQRTRYINPAKLRESRTAPENLKEVPLSTSIGGRTDTGSIIEKIKKQTEFNAYTSYNDKFHIKVQRVGYQDTQEKSFQSSHTQKSQATIHSYASRKTNGSYNNTKGGTDGTQKKMKRENKSKGENLEVLLSHSKKQSVQYDDLLEADQINLGLNQGHFWAVPYRGGEMHHHQHMYDKSSSGMESSRDYNMSKTMLEQHSEYPSETLSQVLDEGSYKNVTVKPGVQQLKNIAGTQMKKYHNIELNVGKSLPESEKGNSKGSTARSIMERNNKEIGLERQIDEQEEEEEDLLMVNKQKQSGLSFLKNDKSKKKLRTVKEQRDSFKKKIVPEVPKPEFKMTFMANWEGHMNTVTSIVKDVVTETIWTASRDRTIRGWDMKTIFERRNSGSSGKMENEKNQIVLKDKKGIEVLMYDSSNRLLLSGGADHDIKVWEPTTGKMLRVLKGHKGGVFGLTKMGRNALLSCSGDQTIKKWDLHKEVCTDMWNEHSNRVTGILYDREKFAHSFMSCCADGKIKMWDFRTEESVATFTDHDLDVTSLLFMGGSYNMVSGSLDKTVKIWDLNMRKVETSINIGAPVHSLAYYSRVDKLIVGSDNLKVIDVEDDYKIQAYEDEYQGSIRSLLVDEELDLLYTGSTENIVKVWFMRTSL